MKIKAVLLFALSLTLWACSSVEPTEECETHSTSTVLAASATTLEVGEEITVTVALSNEGCVALGIPQYRLYVEPAGDVAILDPSQPDPVVHSLGVSPGQSDAAEFILRAVNSGETTITATASFEVHLDYPGPAYWGISSTEEPLVVVVVPSDG